MDAERPAICLDGSHLEGGGQILRLALSIASVTGRAVKVDKIRANRAAKPFSSKKSKEREATLKATRGAARSTDNGGAGDAGSAREHAACGQPRLGKRSGGGLKNSHLASAKFLAHATSASKIGLEIGSLELLFSPPPTTSADRRFGANSLEGGVWTDIYGPYPREIGQEWEIVGREATITLTSPGSVTLILQAILPWLLMGSPCSSNSPPSSSLPPPLKVTIQGGTNVTSAPSYDYTAQVLLPLLNAYLAPLYPTSSPAITSELRSRGWCFGRDLRPGKVSFRVQPLPPNSTLPPLRLQDPGRLTQIHATILAPSDRWIDRTMDRISEAVEARWKDVELDFPVFRKTGHSHKFYVLLVAETSTGCRIGRDHLFVPVSARTAAEVQRERTRQADLLVEEQVVEGTVRTAIGHLEEEISSGACVDEHMQDQLVVFQTLAEGRSVVRGRRRADEQEIAREEEVKSYDQVKGKQVGSSGDSDDGGAGHGATLHTKTARWVAQTMLDDKEIVFTEDGSCHRLGAREGAGHIEDEEEVGVGTLATSMGAVTIEEHKDGG